ncbi:MAG: hypothetical protein RLZZ628_2594 [Bacteroidota bacterium]|jgi:hypothetical protein
MKLRILSWILIILFLMINVISLSPEWMEWIVHCRTQSTTFFPTSRQHFGDLYNLTHLKKFGKKGWNPHFEPNYCDKPKNIDLYTLNDSYLQRRFDTSAFCGVRKLTQSFWDGDAPYIQLDSQKINILIIETVERYLRIRGSNMGWMKHFNFGAPPKPTNNVPMTEKITLQTLKKHFFNPHIHQNLEFNLLDYKTFAPLWETRATLTHELFNRVPPVVTVAGKGAYLVLTETVDGKQSAASNFPILEEELQVLVKNWNEIQQFYLEKGFSAVYLSVIPNPIHIVDLQFTYNQLIPKLQNHPNLKIPVIDIYSIFKKNNTQVFPKNETHWTNEGMQLWLDEVNRILNGLN